MTPRADPPKTPFEPLFFRRDALFWPIAGAAGAFAEYQEWPTVSDYGPRLSKVHEEGGLPGPLPRVSFREQPPKPRRKRRVEAGARDLYDGRIALEGWVPTRPGSWHDFLNMLVWGTFPEAKWQLHGRQHRAISARLRAGDGAEAVTLPNARTREQDALALLDEGGVVIAGRAETLDRARAALRERREAEALDIFAKGEARPVVFGHAIFEGLVLGREDGWGAAWLAPHDGDLNDSAALLRAIDAALAAALSRQGTFQSPSDLARVDLRLIRPR